MPLHRVFEVSFSKICRFRMYSYSHSCCRCTWEERPSNTNDANEPMLWDEMIARALQQLLEHTSLAKSEERPPL